jgi:uncharacterized membrane protein YeaQ/YmgE (transglycosylase-associated protein family)
LTTSVLGSDQHRFPPQPHRPDGGFSAAGFLAGSLVCFLVALVVGAIVGFVHQWFYLVLIFPLVMGLILGGIGQFMVKKAKLRNLFLSTLLGAVPAVLMMVVVHFMSFRATLAEMEKLAPGVMELQLSPSAFAQFMDASAVRGVTIGKSGGGINLGYIGTYVYWAVEILGVVAISALMVREGAKAPFCVSCQKWKSEKVLANVHGEEGEVQEAINDGELHRFISQSPEDSPNIAIHVWSCPECEKVGDIEILARTSIQKKKGEIDTKSTKLYTYPGEFLNHIAQAS